MKNSKLVYYSFLHSLGTLIYVALVVVILYNGQNIFGKQMNYLGALAMLLLFVLSAIIVGLFVLGRPILLYLDNQKKEAIKLLFYTVGWLFLFTMITFITLLLIK